MFATLPAVLAARSLTPFTQLRFLLERAFTEQGLEEAWPRFARELVADSRYGLEVALTGDEARSLAADLLRRLDRAIHGSAAPVWVANPRHPGWIELAQVNDSVMDAAHEAAQAADLIVDAFGNGEHTLVASNFAHRACYAAAESYGHRVSSFAEKEAGAAHNAAVERHYAWQLYKLAQAIKDTEGRAFDDAHEEHLHDLAHDR